MKKLALVALLAVASVALFTLSPAAAQIRRGGRVPLGSVDTPVYVQGVLLPADSTLGVTIDAGAPATQALSVLGATTLNGNLTAASTTAAGTCTLNAASPAVCTATVRASCRPICTIQGGTAAIAAKGVACAVASTTLTATSANAATEVVSYLCL